VPGDFPYLPAASPNQQQIAYFTAADRELLKVVGRDGQIRELGAARSACRPLWTNDDHLWVVQGSDSNLVWAELDANTGERVRTLPLNEKLPYVFHGCGLRTAPPGISSPPKVNAWSSETTDIRVLTR
jgi:hypothetical protein